MKILIVEDETAAYENLADMIRRMVPLSRSLIR